VERAAPGGKCPRCRRVYDAGTRFCAVDAEELVPLPLWQASHADAGGVHVDEADAGAAAGARTASAVHFHGEGKICPVCAAKYDLEASFCGRDGSELVTVN
jgi:predicted amidophosphoribosyltransferase